MSTTPPPSQHSSHASSIITADRSGAAVNNALLGNIVIFACKVWAWYVTRSSAMLAEAVHTLADIGNQVGMTVVFPCRVVITVEFGLSNRHC